MNLTQFANSVLTIGATNTILAQGEPGIGKSSVLKMLKKRLSDTHNISYIDCAQLDLGDFALPFVVSIDDTNDTYNDTGAKKVTRFAPNARFRAHEGKPVVVMLDELGKAARPVQNVLLTLLLEHRIGDVVLPEGSIVFATTNLSSDGVGDKIEAHARNRMVIVNIDKPTVEQWCEWALYADVAPEILAFVEAFPQVLASYTTLAAGEKNPYIFDPRTTGNNAFVTPRSLEAASNIVKQRATLGTHVTTELLSGCVGRSAAADMATFISFGDQMPQWTTIMQAPDKAPVPESPIVRTMLVRNAVQRVSQGDVSSVDIAEKRVEMDQWMKYLERLEPELVALFCLSIGKAPMLLVKPWIGGNRAYIEVMTRNAWTFTR